MSTFLRATSIIARAKRHNARILNVHITNSRIFVETSIANRSNSLADCKFCIAGQRHRQSVGTYAFQPDSGQSTSCWSIITPVSDYLDIGWHMAIGCSFPGLPAWSDGHRFRPGQQRSRVGKWPLRIWQSGPKLAASSVLCMYLQTEVNYRARGIFEVNNVITSRGGTRTHTARPGQGILSPSRLPFRHSACFQGSLCLSILCQ